MRGMVFQGEFCVLQVSFFTFLLAVHMLTKTSVLVCGQNVKGNY